MESLKILSLKRSLRSSLGLVLESPKDFRTGYRRRMRWNKCSNSNCLRSETELEIQNRLKVHFGTYLASFCNFSWISHTFWTTNYKIKLYLPSLKATWAILVSSGKKFRYDTSLGRYSWSLTNLSWILMNFVVKQTGLKSFQRKL